MRDVSYDLLDLLDQYGNDEEGLEAILADNDCPEYLYALSKIRENLLEWYKFGKDSRVLQIGSDYGALTGLLSAKAGRVKVIEERDENLEVNRRRHLGTSNLEFGSGKLKELLEAEEPGSYGSAVVAGVCREWLDEYRDEDGRGQPQGLLLERFLRQVWRILAPGGALLLAVTNSLALRFWAGAAHDEDEAEFTRAELEEISGRLSGLLTAPVFYYPAPDWRLPVSIYSDGYLPSRGELTNRKVAYDRPRYELFSEETAYDQLCAQGDYPRFADSYLVVWQREKV